MEEATCLAVWLASCPGNCSCLVLWEGVSATPCSMSLHLSNGCGKEDKSGKKDYLFVQHNLPWTHRDWGPKISPLGLLPPYVTSLTEEA